MYRFMIGALALGLGISAASAQSLDDLNIQLHGYATQGFLYTNQNNIFTTNSSNGSPAWTEAVINVTAQPDPKLRVGVQARYSVLGNLGNAITLDWAMADYKVNDKIGVRFGKVKTPSGLFNDVQDIDPSYNWALLPQTVYPLMSRNSLLAHYGGVAYGTFDMERGGKFEYRGWIGERLLPGSDGYFLNQTEQGISLPNGLGGITSGATLRWRTPIAGLLVGATDYRDNTWKGQLSAGGGALTGAELLNPFNAQYEFARYDHKRWMAAAEHSRLPVSGAINFTGLPSEPLRYDAQAWYVMTTYKLTDKLAAGVYDTQLFDHQSALGPSRYLKDWAINAHYDFNQFIYAKAEQHFMDGTASGFDLTMNPPTASLPTGLAPTTRLTVLKIGVSF